MGKKYLSHADSGEQNYNFTGLSTDDGSMLPRFEYVHNRHLKETAEVRRVSLILLYVHRSSPSSGGPQTGSLIIYIFLFFFSISVDKKKGPSQFQPSHPSSSPYLFFYCPVYNFLM